MKTFSAKPAHQQSNIAAIMMEILSILWRPGRSLCDKDRGQTFSGRRWCFCVSLLLLHEQIQWFLNTCRAAEPSPQEGEEALLSPLLLVTAGCFRQDAIVCLSPWPFISSSMKIHFLQRQSVLMVMLVLFALLLRCSHEEPVGSSWVYGHTGIITATLYQFWSIVAPNYF